MKESTININWGEVKHAFVSGVHNKDFSSPMAQHLGDAWEYQCGEWASSRGGWNGASAAEMKKWLHEGYQAPEFKVAESYIPDRKRRRLSLAEEGEIDLPLAWSGHDYPYLSWDKRARKPGLKVIIEYAFACGVSSGTIKQYAVWLTGMLSGFEQDGYDLEVAVRISLDNLCREKRGLRTHTVISVKEINEASDFTEWSALFSPGGFRQLGFTAMYMTAHRLRDHPTGGLGTTLAGGSWDCEFTPEVRELVIRCPQRAGYSDGKNFPAQQMTEKVQSLHI
jgi:hypothetical protein